MNLVQERAWFKGGSVHILNQDPKLEIFILLFSSVLVRLGF